MFRSELKGDYRRLADRAWQQTLVYGKNTLLARFKLEKGGAVPDHRHPHEQTGFLVSGCLELTIDGVTHRAEAGSSWCIPGDTPHSAVAVEDSVAVEVFSPVREDYLP